MRKITAILLMCWLVATTAFAREKTCNRCGVVYNKPSCPYCLGSGDETCKEKKDNKSGDTDLSKLKKAFFSF